MSFYGNTTIKNLLQFDKIYSSRTAMDEAIGIDEETNKYKDDGVFLNRFVFVYYEEDSDGQTDRENYEGSTYDRTFWKKVFDPTDETKPIKYELILDVKPVPLVWETF